MKLRIYPEYEQQYNREINYEYKVLDRTNVIYFEGNYTECLNYIIKREEYRCKK